MALLRTLTVLVVAMLAAACGSSKSSSSSPAAWADGLCSAFTKWETSLRSVSPRLENPSQLSRSRLERTARDVSNATATLRGDLKRLGEPPNTGTAEAKSAVQQLSRQLKASADQIETAAKNISSGQAVVPNVAVASSAASTMVTDVSATVSKLRSTSATDEWKRAFEQSQACRAFVKS